MQQSFKPNICKSYETSKLGKGNDFLKHLQKSRCSVHRTKLPSPFPSLLQTWRCVLFKWLNSTHTSLSQKGTYWLVRVHGVEVRAAGLRSQGLEWDCGRLKDMLLPSTPRYRHLLISGACRCYLICKGVSTALYGKDVIKLRISRGGAYAGLSRWATHAITCILVRERQRDIRHRQRRRDTHREANMKMAAETAVLWPQTQEYQGTLAATRTWKRQGTDPPQSLQRKHCPADTLFSVF